MPGTTVSRASVAFVDGTVRTGARLTRTGAGRKLGGGAVLAYAGNRTRSTGPTSKQPVSSSNA